MIEVRKQKGTSGVLQTDVDARLRRMMPEMESELSI